MPDNLAYQDDGKLNDAMELSTANHTMPSTNRRQEALNRLRSVCEEWTAKLDPSVLTIKSFCPLFCQLEVLKALFQLLDHAATGKIVATDLIEFLRDKVRSMALANGQEFVDQLDTGAYVAARTAGLQLKDLQFDLELFVCSFRSKGVLTKLYRLIEPDQNSNDGVSVERLVRFVGELTMRRKTLSSEHLELIDQYFNTMIAKSNTTQLTLDDFKKMIPCKNPFFAERAFRVFDKDGSNSISINEFREGLRQFCGQSVEDKVRFLFQIYDQDGDGYISLDELKAVMKSCIEESGMKFSDEQMDQLTMALYQDAAGSLQPANPDEDRGIQYEQLKAQMDKHEGLLENLSISLEKFLFPVPTAKTKQLASWLPLTPRKTSWRLYVRNNIPYVSYLAVYFAINMALTIGRIVEYKDTYRLYMIARIGGQLLNFNCSLAAVLMLRHCIAWLRMHGLASWLPLDRHVYLHKMCGVAIVVAGLVHTVAHIFDFWLNIAVDLVATNATVNGTNGFTTIEWLFTTKTNTFGLIPGIACITGWPILACLVVIGLCSIPAVRRNGSFEVFYYTHLLYVPFWILLIFHTPHFYWWFFVPGVLFVLLELGAQFMLRWVGKGRTHISSAALLPSRVTHLTIQKPANFNYHPGDYVYIKIPSIASAEWHPFTISSAPELTGSIWLHIRAVGGWTTKLYEHFEKEQTRQRILHSSINGMKASLYGNIRRRRSTEPSLFEATLPNTATVESGGLTTSKLEVIIDGPYGAPSSHIFSAEHAVLIATGIGVTPFASILQSIMNRYYASQLTCPQCKHSWTNEMPESIMKLKKVDFFWINREQQSFEWFVNLLSQLETEQTEAGGALDRFLDLHMYITSALKRTDMKAVGLQMALDLLHAKEKRDLVTGLKTRTHAGRPNWEKMFHTIRDQNKGKVTVFYCGPPQLAKELCIKCDEFGFSFRKEIF